MPPTIPSFSEKTRRARELQAEFRRAPVGGKLVALKRLFYRLTASAFDRQAKAVEALLEAVEEAGAGASDLARTPEPSDPAAANLPEGTPRSLSGISEIAASMSQPERVLLYGLIFGLKPRRCLEIGTLHGGSAAVICAAMDDNGFGRLVCVDPEPRVTPENRQRIASRATMVQGSSPQVLAQARQEAGGRFDFALIDGDHSVPGVLRDVEGVLEHVTGEAYLLFHDAHFIDVAEAIDEVLRRHPRRLSDCGVLSVFRNPAAGETYRGRPVVWGGMRLLRCRPQAEPQGIMSPNEEALRICLLSVEYPPRSTHGIARHTHSMTLGLVALGHEVHVVTLGERADVRRQDGALVHAVPALVRPPYDRLRAAGYEDLAIWTAYSHAVHDRVEELRREHRVRVVDSPLWNLDGLVCAVAGKLPVAVRIATAMKQISAIHDMPTAEHALMAELETRFLTMADAWIANSQASVRALREVYGLDPERTLCEVVPHGIAPCPEAGVAPLDPHRRGPVTVLFVGRLEGRKGILDLFAAIPAVLAAAPETRFVIAGSDNSVADGFRAREGTDYPGWFRRRFPQHRGRVEFLGLVDEPKLDELYRGCDVFVAPSLYESFGLIYLEAMNRARPVVACRAGGPQEIVVDGETGLLVPPADGEALAQALCRLVADPRLRSDMGRAGRARLLARYTHEKMAQGFVEIYRRMIAGR